MFRSTILSVSTTPTLVVGSSVNSAIVSNVFTVPGDVGQAILWNYTTAGQIQLSGTSVAAASGLFIIPPSTGALSGAEGTFSVTVPLRPGDDLWAATTAGTANLGILANRQASA